MIDVKLIADRAKQTFIRLAKRIDDLTPIWEKFITYYQYDLMPQVWNSRGAAMGEKWAPYKQDENGISKYLIWKRKHGSSRMMILYGRLIGAATGGQGWFQKLQPKSLTIGIEGIPYSGAMQYGYKGIPARPYFFNKNDDLPPRAWKFLIDETNKELESIDTEK